MSFSPCSMSAEFQRWPRPQKTLPLEKIFFSGFHRHFRGKIWFSGNWPHNALDLLGRGTGYRTTTCIPKLPPTGCLYPRFPGKRRRYNLAAATAKLAQRPFHRPLNERMRHASSGRDPVNFFAVPHLPRSIHSPPPRRDDRWSIRAVFSPIAGSGRRPEKISRAN